jgi:hypothetical protein
MWFVLWWSRRCNFKIKEKREVLRKQEVKKKGKFTENSTPKNEVPPSEQGGRERERERDLPIEVDKRVLCFFVLSQNPIAFERETIDAIGFHTHAAEKN